MSLKARLKGRVIAWFIEGIWKTIQTGKSTLRFRIAMGELSAFFRRYENMESKKWYQSRTVWVNILNGILVVGTSIVSPEIVTDPRVIQAWATATTVINLILRAITNTSVTK